MRHDYPIRFVCAVLRASVGGYYAWLGREEKPTEKEERLSVLVLAAHDKTRRSYGAQRLHEELVEDGCAVGLYKVKKIRRQLGITCKRKHRFVRTTDSKHALPVAPNLVDRNFVRTECNRVWVSGITYIPTEQGFVYLAGIKDLCGKEIAGFSLSHA